MTGDLAFVGDVHLDRDDALLEPLLAWLDRLGGSCATIVFIGDLFNLWIGDRALEAPHHTAVVERLTALRQAGVAVHYVEGNRDYRIGEAYEGSAFDTVAGDSLTIECGGTRVWAAHGNLVNLDDRQYRTWHRLSRSAPLWALFRLIPGGSRAGVAERIERRMRATNLDYKASFPEAMVRRYAEPQFAAGHDLVVLGHFHQEHDLPTEDGRIIVLPSWRDARRFLRITAAGHAAFESAPS